jgi:hypothetical protein
MQHSARSGGEGTSGKLTTVHDHPFFGKRVPQSVDFAVGKIRFVRAKETTSFLRPPASWRIEKHE